MLWKRPTKESISILDMVRVNDRLQLSFRGRDYLSRVEDVQDGNLFVAVPMTGSSVVPMKSGEQLTVNVFVDVGIWSFASVVTQYVDGRVPYIILSGFKDKGKVQRRGYVRVADKQPIRYRREGGQANADPWIQANTMDMSGGGVQFTCDGESIREGAFIEMEIILPGCDAATAIARVVRAWKTPGNSGLYHAGVEFVQIHPNDRRIIVQYVQKKQTEMMSSRRNMS